MSTRNKRTEGRSSSGSMDRVGFATSYEPVATKRAETYEERVQRQIAIGRRIIEEDRDILRELAK